MHTTANAIGVKFTTYPECSLNSCNTEGKLDRDTTRTCQLTYLERSPCDRPRSETHSYMQQQAVICSAQGRQTKSDSNNTEPYGNFGLKSSAKIGALKPSIDRTILRQAALTQPPSTIAQTHSKVVKSIIWTVLSTEADAIRVEANRSGEGCRRDI